MPAAEPMAAIVAQHVEDLLSLAIARRRMVLAPDATLLLLGRLDERLVANLEGIVLAGATGRRAIRPLLAHEGYGAIFAATLALLATGDKAGALRVGALVDALPQRAGEFGDALAYAEPDLLAGVVAPLLAGSGAATRAAGLLACAAHGVDPGPALGLALRDAVPALRAAASQAAAVLGRTDLLEDVLAAANASDDEASRCDGLLAAIVLGERRRWPTVEAVTGLSDPRRRFDLAAAMVMASPADIAHRLLTAMSRGNWSPREMIVGAGIAGDPRYVPWLLEKMAQPASARAAGEAFAMITGLDLGRGFDRVSDIPTIEDPAGHGAVAQGLDPASDDGLPYPDRARCSDWWHAERARFTDGVRYLHGVPVSLQQCLVVLRQGGQRQRKAAALHRCLLQPGQRGFPCAAPAWRQRDLLRAASQQPAG